MDGFVVKFDRVGRNHNVAPLRVATEDELDEAIYRHVRPHLNSRDVEVYYSVEEGRGFISCGMRSGGAFTITAEPVSVVSP